MCIRDRDKGLKALFAEEENLSGIFNWCLEGYKEFRKFRLASPNAVVEAIQDYRNDSDRIGQFIEAWLEEGEAYEVRSAAAYKLYSDWCRKYNYNAENVKNFKNAIDVYKRQTQRSALVPFPYSRWSTALCVRTE